MLLCLLVSCSPTDQPSHEDLPNSEAPRPDDQRLAHALSQLEDFNRRLMALEEAMARLEGAQRPLPRSDRQLPGAAPADRRQAAWKGQSADFSAAREGQIFPQYGSPNMIVETSAGRGLTSASNIPVDLVFTDFSVAERAEVMVSLRTGFWTDQQISLWDDDRKIIAVTLSNYDLRFGDHAKKRSSSGWKRGEESNQLRIVIEDNNAWLYVNKKFFGVQKVDFKKTNRLKITGIKRDQDFVYAISVQPLS